MTIVARGHVESMAIGHKGKFALTLVIEAERMQQPIIIEATPEELGALYRPGTPIELRILPVVASPKDAP